VSNAEWAGGVGADKLDQHFLAAADIGLPEPVILLVNRRENRGPDVFTKKEVDKSRSCYINALDHRLSFEQARQLHCEVTWFAFVQSGCDQGEIGGEITLPIAFGHLYGIPSSGSHGPPTTFNAIGKTRIDNCFDLRFYHVVLRTMYAGFKTFFRRSALICN
jgi:hypothetical protein